MAGPSNGCRDPKKKKKKKKKNNNNHFILGRSVSPSKWTHCGEGFSPLWGGGFVMPTIRPTLSQLSRPMRSSHYILDYGRPGNLYTTTQKNNASDELGGSAFHGTLAHPTRI